MAFVLWHYSTFDNDGLCELVKCDCMHVPGHQRRMYCMCAHAAHIVNRQSKIKFMIFCSKHVLQEKLSRIVEWSDLIKFFFALERGEFSTGRNELRFLISLLKTNIIKIIKPCAIWTYSKSYFMVSKIEF